MIEYIIKWDGIARQLMELRNNGVPLQLWSKRIRAERLREPIVRCKDCKNFYVLKEECFAHWEEGITEGIAFSVTPDDFCSWGEPREGSDR